VTYLLTGGWAQEWTALVAAHWLASKFTAGLKTRLCEEMCTFMRFMTLSDEDWKLLASQKLGLLKEA
jgi:hypothetical protein